MQARLLIAAGREAEARQLLSAAIPSSPEARAVWIRNAGESVPSAAVGRVWLEQVRPLASSGTERVTLARAQMALAARFPGEAKAVLGECEKELAEYCGGAGDAAAWEVVGQVREKLGDGAGARVAFESALKIDGGRPASLMGLALILAAQDPGAALPLAEKAVAANPDVASLDLLGSIRVAIAEHAKSEGKTDAAADSYRAAAEAYRQMALLKPAGPEGWYKAAQAATSGGDFAMASACWDRLIEIPGLPTGVVAAAKNNLAMAMLKQDPKPEQLERARRLVSEAIAVSAEPAFRDSLGWVELQAGRRVQAIEAFRGALGSGKPAERPSTAVGLAMALATGTPAERKEAADLIRAVDVRELDPALAEKLKRARAMVDAEKP
jgi:tetratricopeptide (TPR) repeat protein